MELIKALLAQSASVAEGKSIPGFANEVVKVHDIEGLKKLAARAVTNEDVKTILFHSGMVRKGTAVKTGAELLEAMKVAATLVERKGDMDADALPAKSESLPPMAKSLEAYHDAVAAAGRRIDSETKKLENTRTVYKAYDRKGKVFAWYKEPQSSVKPAKKK